MMRTAAKAFAIFVDFVVIIALIVIAVWCIWHPGICCNHGIEEKLVFTWLWTGMIPAVLITGAAFIP